MSFDAAAARALAGRSSDLLGILFRAKQAIVDAAGRGEFTAVAPLPAPVPVPAGAPVDAPDFLATLLREAGEPVALECLREFERAGYAVRPGWGAAGAAAGRTLAGLLLDWSIDSALPARGAAPALRIVAAADAHAMSAQARAPRLWVERALLAVRKAAEASQLSCHLQDPEPPASPAWALRREMLEAAGFRLELTASDSGSVARLSW
ncbi:MAG: hypothetical protein HYZ20_07790 [Burkholderiales bacterium]|nr:hypothetical protein [Burkholderiales bacterium]